MRPDEAQEITELVSALEFDSGAVCLNVGSSTRQFRQIDKPHIQTLLIEPLERIGIQFVHCDLKTGLGVDMVGDVLDPEFRQKMRALNPTMLLCCNLLEHLSDPGSFAEACGDLVHPHGVMIISVPFSFPRHDDPIDNMLRPSPDEISTMFPGWELFEGRIVRSGSYLTDLIQRKNGLVMLVKDIGAVILPFLSKGKWYPRAHRLLWLFRPYKISIAVLKRKSN